MPYSSSQKLCRAGERECETGQPMIPASRVLPVILIASASSRQRTPLAQIFQQLYQRQTEDREVIAAYPREQLHAPSFQAIGADRAEQRFALGSDIVVKKRIAEPAHRQLRHAGAGPQRFSG